MKFKIGDIVYCIENNRTELLIDEPYTIESYNMKYGFRFIKLENEISYMTNRFISNKEYQINHRKEKINKLKTLIKNK